MMKIGFGLIIILSIFGIMGSFFSTLIFHEVTHIYQSNEAISLSYDILQPTFSHVLHNVQAWDNNNGFINFVQYTEASADKREAYFGYFCSFLIGTCVFSLVFKKLDEENAEYGY